MLGQWRLLQPNNLDQLAYASLLLQEVAQDQQALRIGHCCQQLSCFFGFGAEVRATFDKLGIPLAEQMALAGVAVDAVFDSVSVATTFKEKLAELGISL